MIWHQHVGMHDAVELAEGILHHAKEHLVVPFAEEARIPIVPSLHYVERDIRKNGTSMAAHTLSFQGEIPSKLSLLT